MIYWLEGQGIFEEEAIARELKERHKIFCRRVGLNKRSRQTTEFRQPPFLVDTQSLAYIYERKLFKIENINEKKMEEVLTSCQYKVYCNLKPLYFLMDGSKFGSTFLAYESDPEQNHATLLVFTEGGIVDASRLATIAKKRCVYVNPGSLQCYQIQFNS